MHAVHPRGVMGDAGHIPRIQLHGAVSEGTLVLKDAFQVGGNPVNGLENQTVHVLCARLAHDPHARQQVSHHGKGAAAGRALARVLRRVGVAEAGVHQSDARELFRRMVFNILMDNTDDHEKNHALLVVNPYGNGRLKLAPAYDILPTHSGQGHQEFICGALGHESTLDNAMSECEAFGLLPNEAAQEVARVIEVVDGWRTHLAQVGVSAADIEYLGQFIDGDELLAQRMGFEASRFANAGGKRAKPVKRGPFSV